MATLVFGLQQSLAGYVDHLHLIFVRDGVPLVERGVDGISQHAIVTRAESDRYSTTMVTIIRG
jgi:hypothetical protein